MISGVPVDEVVSRTARVRLALTVAGCDLSEETRTARVRDGVVVVVTGVMVDGKVTGVMVLPVLLAVLPLLLIIDGSDAADGIETFPIARDCTVDGAVTELVVPVVTVAPLVDRATLTGATVKVGEGTPIDDCVGVGVPITTCDGAAVAADAAVTGAVAVPVPATVAAAVVPVIAPVVATVEAAVVPPLPITIPVAASLMTAGVGSELMERLTVV